MYIEVVNQDIVFTFFNSKKIHTGTKNIGPPMDLFKLLQIMIFEKI